VVNRFGTDQISIVGSFGATVTFGTPGVAAPVTAVNATDVFLVNALLQ
jgi:hypothetical protein